MKSVSKKAVLGRINRKLAHDGEQLRKTRIGTDDFNALGEYYLVNTKTGDVICDDVGLGDVGQSLDILKPDEMVGE